MYFLQVKVPQFYLKDSLRLAVWTPCNAFTDCKIAVPYEHGQEHPELYTAVEAFDGEVSTLEKPLDIFLFG